MKRQVLAGVVAGAAALALFGTEGWEDADPSRVFPAPTELLWSAPSSGGAAAFTVEKTGGAEGEVLFAGDSIEIRKTNATGRILVRPRAIPTFAKGRELQSSIACEVLGGADPQAARGYIRLVGKQWTLAHFLGLDKGGMSQSPQLVEMVNGAPGEWTRKICRFIVDEGPVTPVLVVEGAPSHSRWSHWTVEDHKAAKAAWRARAVTGRNPPDRAATQEDEASFDRALAADKDHTAAVVTQAGVSRLAIDGRIVPPVFHKPIPFGPGVPFTFEGRIFENEGKVNLQTVNVRFGVGGGRLGFWSAGDRFDLAGAVRHVKTTMRAAPHSLFLVTIRLDAYPEYADEHPTERWLLAGGSPVWGNCSFGRASPSPEPPKEMWRWVSTHSPVWRADVARHLTEFVAELRRTGLAKRIVGVHFAGYHDGQFATMAPDFSPCAVAGFRARQMREQGRVIWPEAPAFADGLDFFDTTTNAAQYAYQRHLRLVPFEVQEEMARVFKRAIGKPVIAGRWCMVPFSASGCAAVDITPFVMSDAMDFLVSQPGYELRAPGLAAPPTLPGASFAAHRKLYLGEFDLRTWHGRSGDDELKGLYLSEARDEAMWRALHRKLAGRQLASRQGWWYFDMTDNWFDDRRIQREIADVQAYHRASLANAVTAWSPSVAVVIDEDGLLRRNRLRGRTNLDENANTSVQLRLFGRAGVPYDIVLMEDALTHPATLAGKRYVFFLGAYRLESRRLALVRALRARGVSLAFSHHAGCLGGAAALAGDAGIAVAAKSGGVSAGEFHDAVVAAGGYAPLPAGVAQIDMNGDFISLHGLVTGTYDFKLPRDCRVRNLKTGRLEPTRGNILPLDLHGRATYWFALDE